MRLDTSSAKSKRSEATLILAGLIVFLFVCFAIWAGIRTAEAAGQRARDGDTARLVVGLAGVGVFVCGMVYVLAQ